MRDGDPPDHAPDHGLDDRWRGALLGTALGDAVGAPFEGRRQVEVAEVEAWLAADEQLVWTDDTAMTLGLARSLAACDGEVDPQHLGDTFAEVFRAEPWRGYGAGPPRIFAAAARGTPYLDAAAAQFDGRGSFGNGAAMRAAPAAIIGGGDLGRVAALARAQARVTHAHPLGQDGAALLALAVAAVATGAGVDPAAAIATTLDQLETRELRDAASTALTLGPTATPTVIADRLGNGIAALQAVPAALAAFLGAPDDPRTVLVRAVTIGGDTDTIAAMAGAMVGARVGARGLPADLLDRLEARDDLVAGADALGRHR
jgi:poly(ADP-ribose) glycohydrolase ARH3